MKVEHGTNAFSNEMIDEFVKKRRNELIYKKILMTHYFHILLFSLVTNSSHFRY